MLPLPFLVTHYSHSPLHLMVTATAALTAAIERVGKVLALEQRQGHRDHAVLGGIGPFAHQHLAPLRGSLPTRAADDALARIDTLLRDYAASHPRPCASPA